MLRKSVIQNLSKEQCQQVNFVSTLSKHAERELFGVLFLFGILVTIEAGF